MSKPANSPAADAAIGCLEALISRDVGRNIDALITAARGGLLGAATAIAGHSKPRVGIISGFFLPHATPPAAENDGPVGVAHLVAGFRAAGIPCRVATDTPSEGALKAALAVAGVTDTVELDIATVEGANWTGGKSVAAITAAWKKAGITHALSIERCGLGESGRPHNARGKDISAHTAPLDHLFTGSDWTTLAIGDGGNEVGMGFIDADIIKANIKNGETVACRTPADHLMVCGVSNWGGWGLLAALALLLPHKKDQLTATLNRETDLAFLRHINTFGPCCDAGALMARDAVDNIQWETHAELLDQINEVIA